MARSTCFFKDEDFQEEDVWGSIEASRIRLNTLKPFSSSSSSSRSILSTPRMIPKKDTNTNSNKEFTKRSSAPLSIPNRHVVMMMAHDHHHAHDDDDGYGDDLDEMVPPHEYIAKRQARAQISSFSVCEGVGRKLKGRDLSEVRNGVLRKTGFLE